jgi:hypothetical protein
MKQKLLSSPVVLLALPNTSLQYEDFLSKDHAEQIEGMLEWAASRCRRLKDEGYDVQFVGPQKCNDITKKQWIIKTELEAVTGKMLEVSVNSYDAMRSMLWPRDIFQVYGGQVISAPHMARMTAEILAQLGISGENVAENQLGVGGYVVPVGDKLFISGAVKEKTIELIRDEGYETFTVPYYEESFQTKHIDYLWNTTLDRDGFLVTFLEQRYYDQFGHDIRKILREASSDYDIIPGPFEVNFVRLPDGRIEIPDSHKTITDIFNASLGEEMVIKTPIYDYLTFPGGGLRCASLVIQ